MLLLADRNFAAGYLAAQIAAARADFLIRVRTGSTAPKLPILRRLPDGSWLSRFGGVPVRVIDAQVTVTTTAGHSTNGLPAGHTLLDAARYPAGDLAVPVPRKMGDRDVPSMVRVKLGSSFTASPLPAGSVAWIAGSSGLWSSSRAGGRGVRVAGRVRPCRRG